MLVNEEKSARTSNTFILGNNILPFLSTQGLSLAIYCSNEPLCLGLKLKLVVFALDTILGANDGKRVILQIIQILKIFARPCCPK